MFMRGPDEPAKTLSRVCGYHPEEGLGMDRMRIPMDETPAAGRGAAARERAA
jgi:hypothetical protein